MEHEQQPGAPVEADTATSPEGPSASAEPAQPIVGWEPQAPPPPGLSFAGILRDAFARYGADPVRLFLAFLVPSVLSFVVATDQVTTSLVSILSLFVTSIAFVLADRGPAGSLGFAASRGTRRFGWLFITSVVVGLLGFGLILIVGLPVVIVFGRSALLAVVLLVAILPVIWYLARLSLALPAVVVDGMRPNPSLARSRAATRKPSAAASLIFALIVVGLASLPGGLAAGTLLVANIVPQWVVYVLGGVLTAIVAPLWPLTLLSAYRRVHPAQALPGAPTPAEVEAAAPPGVVEPPLVPAPEFGARARGLIAAVAGVAVVGMVVFALSIGSIVAGILGPGSFFGGGPGIARGTIAFGTAANLSACSVTGAFTTTTSDGKVAWVGAFAKRTTPSDEIRLAISINGTEVGNQLQSSGTYDCLGSPQAETGLTPGTYELRLLVNNVVSARGSFTVR